MSPTLTLKMDDFAMEALADFAQRQGASASRVVALAARYYLADSEHEHPAWRVPRSAQKAESERPPAGIGIELDEGSWRALREEAGRQHVDIGVLAAHAVLYFMTDVDSGRVAERMADAMTERGRD